jgi:hypothetical protein
MADSGVGGLVNIRVFAVALPHFLVCEVEMASLNGLGMD